MHPATAAATPAPAVKLAAAPWLGVGLRVAEVVVVAVPFLAGVVASAADVALEAVVLSLLDVLAAAVVEALVVFVAEPLLVLDSVPEEAVEDPVVLLLPPSATSFSILKWLDHWYTVSSELSRILMPYVLSVPSVEFTSHL